MANNITVEQTAQMLLDNDNILLMCHKSPDGDTLGSAAALCYGLKQAGKTCAVVCADKIPAKYDYLNLPVYAGEFDIKLKKVGNSELSRKLSLNKAIRKN